MIYVAGGARNPSVYYRERQAMAHTDCCALAIAAGDFRGIVKRYPQVSGTALDIVAARLRTLHELVEQLGARSVEQRIASIRSRWPGNWARSAATRCSSRPRFPGLITAAQPRSTRVHR